MDTIYRYARRKQRKLHLRGSDLAGAALAVPLAMLGIGESGEVVEVRGGHGLRRHLAAMGFIPGAVVSVSSDMGSAGPMMVWLGEGRLMLGRGMAWRVMVRPV